MIENIEQSIKKEIKKISWIHEKSQMQASTIIDPQSGRGFYYEKGRSDDYFYPQGSKNKIPTHPTQRIFDYTRIAYFSSQSKKEIFVLEQRDYLSGETQTTFQVLATSPLQINLETGVFIIYDNQGIPRICDDEALIKFNSPPRKKDMMPENINELFQKYGDILEEAYQKNITNDKKERDFKKNEFNKAGHPWLTKLFDSIEFKETVKLFLTQAQEKNFKSPVLVEQTITNPRSRS